MCSYVFKDYKRSLTVSGFILFNVFECVYHVQII